MIQLPLMSFITPYSPKMNGKVERKNKTLTKLVVAILLELGAAPSW